MFDVFEQLFDTINVLINFIVSSVESLISLISNIPTYLNFLISGISFLPQLFIPFAIATLSLYIVLFIIGR